MNCSKVGWTCVVQSSALPLGPTGLRLLRYTRAEGVLGWSRRAFMLTLSPQQGPSSLAPPDCTLPCLLHSRRGVCMCLGQGHGPCKQCGPVQLGEGLGRALRISLSSHVRSRTEHHAQSWISFGVG
jgi:hypothetical protein